MKYQELLEDFRNNKNLAGKAWEHAYMIEFLNANPITECSMHCFHYQQMLECFFKHFIETKSKFHSYSKMHKIHLLLEELIGTTAFRTDKTKYRGELLGITIYVEEYRYNYDIECDIYFEMTAKCDELLQELIAFARP